MATRELQGELRNRNGQTNQFTVQVDSNLKSIISGVKKLNADISDVLTALVEQEKTLSGANGRSEDNEVDEEEDSDEDAASEMALKKSNSEPPNKRIKSSQR